VLRQTPDSKGCANKVSVRFTFICALGFNRFERQFTALSAGSAQQNAGVTSYLYHFIRKGSKVVV